MSFDLLGPLPSGTNVLEASAGTGKTYAIVGLATRYVAEGVATLSELLLVTFSRAATQELRERTRERLTVTAAALADPAAARTHDDDLVRHLAAGDDAAIALVRQRLLRELSDFDAATIATTHSFCQRMLDALGIAGEREPTVSLVESVDDLVAEVVEDLFVRMYSGGTPRLSLTDAHRVAQAAIIDRHALLAPEADNVTEAGQRVEFAAAVRREVERRKRIGGIRDFDDLLVLLRDTLADPDHGPAACARIQDRYRVVLVDEFQDTDPIQWEILRRAFHGTATLVLVGDPKQAIYAFRGAEVSSYLAAVEVADSREALAINWRSDAGLLTALDHLYGGAALGHEEIVVHPVAASDPERIRRRSGKPLRLRYLPRTGAGPVGRSGFPGVAPLRARVAADLAADVVARLEEGVAPGDIAVLVRRWVHIPFVRDALDRSGVPSVLAGGTSVFVTESATHWLWLLQALGAPHRADRIRIAALTPLLGWPATDLDARGDDIVAEVSGRLREWAALMSTAGFAAMFERLSAETALVGRLLAVSGGERVHTDIRHIAQLLNRAAVEESLGLAALIRWLAARIDDPLSGGGKDRVRRLDSDAAAVQIATVHASKGLEFPYVYVPFAWDGAKNPTPSTLLLHNPAGERVLDVGGKYGPGYQERQRRSDFEEAGEELRLLYVAVTRAESAVVLWWAPGFSTGNSPLHRMLFGRDPGGSTVDMRAAVPDDAAAPGRFAAWADGAPDLIAVEAVGSRDADVRHWQASPLTDVDLAAARFDRVLDSGWRRTSYSALTAAVHELGRVSSEAEDTGTTDEPDAEPLVTEDAAGPPSPMNGFPYGAAFGTLVHEVLEVVDTSAPDLSAELVARCREAVAANLAQLDPVELAAALELVVTTPLGYGTLAQISPRDRLAELDFEIPLAGGDSPISTRVTLRRIAELLRGQLAADDPLASYADLLVGVEATPLRGYLSGSIDLVVRTADGRFVVIDYKTNRLAQGELSVGHFGRAAMAAEMLHAHYPLQALLYSVALHRYLRWRVPAYDPERHLGGVQYLFVRGMIGAETPSGFGVFDWTPPPRLIVGLSDLLAGVS